MTVGRRPGLDPKLLWLWRRPVATAPIRPLVWEPPNAEGAALEKAKRQKKEKRNPEFNYQCSLNDLGQSHWTALSLGFFKYKIEEINLSQIVVKKSVCFGGGLLLFLVFLGLHLWHMEFPRLGVQSHLCQPIPQLQQGQIRATSATYTTAHGRWSLTHWVGPGMEPTSSWILVGFIIIEPQQEFLKKRFLKCMREMICETIYRCQRFLVQCIRAFLSLQTRSVHLLWQMPYAFAWGGLTFLSCCSGDSSPDMS